MQLIRRKNGIYSAKRRDPTRKGGYAVRTLRTKDLKVARKRLAAWKLAAAGCVEPQAPAFGWEAMEAFYVGWATPRRTSLTITTRVRALRALAAFMAPTPPSKLELRHVEDFAGEYRRKTSSTTANQAVMALSSVWSLASKHDLVDSNPFPRFDKFPVEPHDARWLTDQECVRLLGAAQITGRDMHIFVALGLLAGFRKGEIVAARWDWISADGKKIRVAPGHGWKPKGGRVRTVPVAKTLAIILNLYYSTGCEDNYLIAPYVKPKPNRTYRVDTRKQFRALCRSAGLKGVTPHTLRHTFASRLAQGGLDLYRIKEFLGHASITTTERYAHLRSDDGAIDRVALPAPEETANNTS